MEAKLADAIPVAQGRGGRWRTISGWWQWIPLPLAAAYLLSVLIKFNQLIAHTYLNADLASAPVIGELFGGSPAHRQVILGNMGWYSTLMFELSTRWLPAHRQLWEATPYLLVLAGAVLIAWGASRVAGRRGAMVGGVLVLCAGPSALDWLFALNDHSPTWFSLALLGALLMALQCPPAWLTTPWRALMVVAVGIVVGLNGASDPLLLLAGVVPLLLATTAAWALQPGGKRARAWLWTVACVVVAGVFDLLTHALMKHENVILPKDPISAHKLLASGEAVAGNFKLWWQALTVLGNGGFYGEKLGFTSGLRLTCALLSLAAVAWVLPILWHELSRAVEIRSRWPRDGRVRAQDEGMPARGDTMRAQDEGMRAPGEDLPAQSFHPGSDSEMANITSDTQAPRAAWCVYWASSAVMLSASFIFSTDPEDILSDRYLVGMIYAVAALMAVLVTRGILARLAVTAATAVFCLTGVVSLWQGQATANLGNYPTGYIYGLVAKIAKREHLTTGYAGYWDAAPITWGTHMQVKVYPVQGCNGENYLCLFYLHYITSWYVPRAGQHTFLISDPTQPISSPAVPSLGKPIAVHQLGRLTMYVYPYDIASRIQP